MEKLATERVQQLTPYLSARRIGGNGDIWLNANESPFINSYHVNTPLNRYSDCQPLELLTIYADYAGVKPQQVLTSRGADEGIELLIRAYCEPGQEAILYCPPTYGMYAVSAETMGVERKIAPLTSQWQLDLPLIESQLEQVKVVFVCSPNNPTGNLIARNDIIALLEMTKDRAIVAIDEAYIDFCPDASVVDLIEQYPNLAILRTLSKAFALAGLRCGFTLANEAIIQVLLKVIAPYPVPVPVADIAIQALNEDGRQRTMQQVAKLNENRIWLEQQLQLLPIVTVYQSKANYLLVQFPNADKLFKAMWEKGIILRRSPIEQCLRISVGDRQECETVVNFIHNYYCHE